MKVLLINGSANKDGCTNRALQEIANAGLCKVFVDRQNRICITTESDAAAVSAIPIYPGNMFSLVSNATLTDFANCIHVEYSTVTVTEDIIDVTDTEVRLDAGQSVDLAIDYTSEIAYPSAVTNNAAVRLTNFDSGTNSCSCTVTNTSATAQTAVITVSGNAIEIKSNKITKRDEVSIELYGTVEYSHTASELVQSLEQAEYIATVLLNKMRAGQGSITTMWRGNPELEIGLEYDCTDRFGETARLVCEYNKFSYDGGLKQETRGEFNAEHIKNARLKRTLFDLKENNDRAGTRRIYYEYPIRCADEHKRHGGVKGVHR